jgi:hypothetical protein
MTAEIYPHFRWLDKVDVANPNLFFKKIEAYAGDIYFINVMHPRDTASITSYGFSSHPCLERFWNANGAIRLLMVF